MPNFDSGIADYIETEATVKVFFPVDHKGNADICCDQCYYYRRNYKTCGLNGEVCQYPNKYVGGSCPLKPVEDGDENGQTDS